MRLSTIQHLFEHDGPFTTVHLDVSQDSEDADQQRQARWTTIRHRLEHAGASAELITALGERAQERTTTPGPASRTLVASGDEVVFDSVRAGGSPEETAEVGPLPDLGGWLRLAEQEIPFLLVVADHEGADLAMYQAQTDPSPERDQVDGTTLHVNKVNTGDYAMKQYQRRSENAWQENAREVADRVRTVWGEHKPRIVVVAGDPRMRSEVVEALAGVPCPVTQVDSGGRAEGASEEKLWADLRVILAELDAYDERDLGERLDRENRVGGEVALGLTDVLDALVKGQVERLVLDLDRARAEVVRPGEHPGLGLPASAAEADELPADRALVAAGAATDAGLSLVPPEVGKGGGIAALLRWSE